MRALPSSDAGRLYVYPHWHGQLLSIRLGLIITLDNILGSVARVFTSLYSGPPLPAVYRTLCRVCGGQTSSAVLLFSFCH
jgi:hypothetical protein